jgi:hypothetical protein
LEGWNYFGEGMKVFWIIGSILIDVSAYFENFLGGMSYCVG